MVITEKEGTCALCKKEKELKESHIIPRAIGNWLKDTSATGYLRQCLTPNVPRQDLHKEYLLCHECEELFSIFEKRFMEKLFLPFQNGIKEFTYDDWLVKFIISLSWRASIGKGYEGLWKPKLKREVDKACEIWRNYLLGETSDKGKYRHHIYFFDIVKPESVQGTIPQYTNHYLHRTVDSTLSFGNNDIFVYNKLPGIMIISHIYPKNMDGWKNTCVENKGELIPQGSKVNYVVYEHLIQSITDVNDMMRDISKQQREKINQKVLKNPERLLKSKSLEAVLADKELNDKLQ